MSGQLPHGLGLVGVTSLLRQFLQDLGGGQGSRRAVQALDTSSCFRHPGTLRGVGVCFFPPGHLLPGDLRQLLVVLNDGPQEKVSARVPLSFSRLLLPDCCLGLWLTSVQLWKFARLRLNCSHLLNSWSFFVFFSFSQNVG